MNIDIGLKYRNYAAFSRFHRPAVNNSGSLFSYLISYVPTDKRESKEDYLTQMFAWVLKNVEGAACLYVKYLCEKAKIDFDVHESQEIEISTQTIVPSGRIDLLINVNKEIAFICEHKVHSALSPNQIQKYKDHSGILGNERYYTVLLTYSKLQHTQKADVSIIWSDVYELYDDHLEEYDSDSAFVLRQFLQFLWENGMGKAEMIPPEAMRGYWPAINLEYKLDLIFRQLAKLDFKELCPGIEQLGSEFDPTYNKSRWGRLGIDMFRKWDLGLFV